MHTFQPLGTDLGDLDRCNFRESNGGQSVDRDLYLIKKCALRTSTKYAWRGFGGILSRIWDILWDQKIFWVLFDGTFVLHRLHITTAPFN